MKIPKPILMDIFQRCGIENFLKISLISKQFYFLLKSDNFWMKMLKNTNWKESEIEEQRKTKKLVEIYQDFLNGWDRKKSNMDLAFYKTKVMKANKDSVCNVFTGKKFFLGKENIVFEFISYFKNQCSSFGIAKENWLFYFILFLFYFYFIFILFLFLIYNFY